MNEGYRVQVVFDDVPFGDDVITYLGNTVRDVILESNKTLTVGGTSAAVLGDIAIDVGFPETGILLHIEFEVYHWTTNT